jgi:hypothetical protein
MNVYIIVYVNEDGWCTQDAVLAGSDREAVTVFIGHHPSARRVVSVTVYFGFDPGTPPAPFFYGY